MALTSDRLTNAAIERLRLDYAKTVNAMGVNVVFQVWDSDTVQDTLYSQPKISKSYTESTVMAVVYHNPGTAILKKVGITEEVDAIVTISSYALAEQSIVPNQKKDRIEIDGISFDVVAHNDNWQGAGTSDVQKDYVVVFGLKKREGRI